MKISPSNLRRVLPVTAGLLLAVGALLAGCSDYPTYTSSGSDVDVNASFYYGAGVYDSWGYYGNPYYGYGGGGAVIVAPGRPAGPHVSPRMR
jgi:hypothetical protein